jgi:hypothetical protein
MSRSLGAVFLCLSSGFLCYPLGYFLGAFYHFSGQAWAEGKGELATSRLRADSGQETDGVYLAMIYIDRRRTMTKKKDREPAGEPNPIRSVLGRVESPDTDNSSSRSITDRDHLPKCVHAAYVGPCFCREGDQWPPSGLRRAEGGSSWEEY